MSFTNIRILAKKPQRRNSFDSVQFPQSTLDTIDSFMKSQSYEYCLNSFGNAFHELKLIEGGAKFSENEKDKYLAVILAYKVTKSRLLKKLKPKKK